MLTKVKGTRDFIDLALFNFITEQIQKHLTLYSFHQIATPLLEYTALFQQSLGAYTDVVTKEMFVIQTNPKSESICLRPEATVPTVRAFIENRVTQVPWKVYSFGPMFRYERPQKGRYRQFHQFNIEVIGAESIAHDTELIVMLDRLFHEKLSLDNYALKINFLGSFDERKKYLDALKKFLSSRKATKICDICKVRAETNTMRVFDCKVPSCQEIYRHAPVPIDYLTKASKAEWTELQEQLELLSISFSYDPLLVRGLDYYSKTVFEFVSDDLGAQNAFCGGGRYDQLVRMLGAKDDQPSLGAAIGIERLILLLEPITERLGLAQEPPLHVIVPLTADHQPLALLLADTLRAADLVVDILFDGSIKSRMRKAHKLGATYTLLLGEEEQQSRTVTIKDMMKGTEERVEQVKAVEYVKK